MVHSRFIYARHATFSPCLNVTFLPCITTSSLSVVIEWARINWGDSVMLRKEGSGVPGGIKSLQATQGAFLRTTKVPLKQFQS